MVPDFHDQTVREALAGASLFLAERNVRHPRLSAEVLMQHVLRVNRAYLYAHGEERLEPQAATRYGEWVRRRSLHEPLQYIVGECEFFGVPFFVREGVLIPRPETELLVEWVLKQRPELPPRPVIADIGTGSGAIAVTLALQLAGATIYAVDISHEALAVARENADRHGVGNRIVFLQGDLLSPLLEQGVAVDVLVSNPPYVASGELPGLDREVVEYEPWLALDGGDDGLLFYRKICARLPALIRQRKRLPGSRFAVALEVGAQQAEPVSAWLREAAGTVAHRVAVDHLADLAGIPRIVTARCTF
jgi:release factor glutamine methyltransferase